MITGLFTPGKMTDLFEKVHESLPVFKISTSSQMVLYTPGCSIKTEGIPTVELRSFFTNPYSIPDQGMRKTVTDIIENARNSLIKWEEKKRAAFRPECLTIHSGSDCNLHCTYCYAASIKTGNKKLTGFPASDSIAAAAEYIISKAAMKSKRMTVAYHGAGEPSCHWDLLTSAFTMLEGIAVSKGIKLFNYIATNGCINELQIKWLAEHMDLIGISCDGPPDIHMAQRTTVASKYPPIETICKRIHGLGGRFDIRVTVTRDNYSRMPEITRYLIENCLASNIRIEPVYLGGINAFRVTDADLFYDYFVQSATMAADYGVGFGYSGVRMEELHSTYCDVSRNTVRLTVDGKSRNCFCFMDERTHFITGGFNKSKRSFSIRPDIDLLKTLAFAIPDECNDCINAYHCSRGCPDFCLFENDYHPVSQLDPFRCRLHQKIAAGHAVATAKTLVGAGSK
ncbi:MAG TPA: hypothetical protein PL123_06825 [Bacteroidales bacterium]|nr:hypothetical protein [Bacteroidales bacterium]